MRTLLILTIVAPNFVLAQNHDPQLSRTVLRASGEATISVRPDQTRLRLAVITTAGSAERAREKNAERTTNVIAHLREFLGQDADIRSISYSVNKSYSSGFLANNTIEARVPDPAISGKVIDVATK